MQPFVLETSDSTKQIFADLLNKADSLSIALKVQAGTSGFTDVNISFKLSSEEYDQVFVKYKPEPIIKDVFWLREPTTWKATGKQFLTRVVLTCRKEGVISAIQIENIPASLSDLRDPSMWYKNKKLIVEKRKYTFDDPKRKGESLTLCLNEDGEIEKIKVVVRHDKKSKSSQLPKS